ncbi:MAG TPA: D-alanyl-D-alanine carboxypeptidase/D-alanyl-D-alanine-endopeptidase [Gaiellaceae bacterium]|nr:D-alanyl-D-alanine carboxypeptidase/D-alanyl-D-alanine-endopeptidase [Gaiellaceae bacterium]
MSARVRLTVAILLALLAVPAAHAARRGSLGQRLARALQAAHVNPRRTGAVVLDLRTGRTVFARNAHLPLLPASNEKLATTYAALTALGPGFRIETDVLGDGAQSGKVWHGDLVLKGYGDPQLTSARLRSLAEQVAAEGIAVVTGRVLGDESWFDTRRAGVGWKREFYLHESPALSALIVDRGWTGHGETPQPALAAAQLFRADLIRAHVAVRGGASLGVAALDAVPLAEVQSPRLASLVTFMDRYSDNFTAEMLMKEVGAVAGRGGTTVAGLRVTRSLLHAAGIPLARVRMVDGSGLSRDDRWTPAALAALLLTMRRDPDVGPNLFAALPIAGKTGTLEYRMRKGPAHGFVRAKTGTTDNSSALSGFVGDRYVFSVVENGWPVRTLNAERSQDRFAQVLARAGRR